MSQIIDRGEPFFYPGNEVGCLLVHGFTGAPEEMRWLGVHLAKQGFTTLGVRLFGHATRPDDLTRARWQDWIANVEDGYHLLRGICSQVVVIGLSLGGALTLTFASQHRIAGAAAMATPWDLPPIVRLLRPIIHPLSKIWRFRRPTEPSDWHDKKAEALNVHYTVQPVRAIAEVYDIHIRMKAALEHIRCPVTLIYSSGDRTIPVAHGKQVLDALGTEQKDLVLVEDSGHNLPRDAEREVVFSIITDFVYRVSGGRP